MELTTMRSLARWATWGCLTCLIMSGCATAGAPAPHGIGAGEWQARLPTTQSPIAELAYGTPGYGALPESDALAAIDQAVLDRGVQAKAKVLRKSRYVRTTHRTQPVAPTAIAKAESLPQPIAAAEPAVTQPSMHADAPAAPLLARNDVTARYAERESQAQQQQEFRGGDAIIISAGALVIVLLIVVLILLLR